MSAVGPKQTWPGALQMSAFRGKLDITNSRFDVRFGMLPVFRCYVWRASTEIEHDPNDFRCSHCSYTAGLWSTASSSLRGPMVRGAGDGQRCVLGLPIRDVRSVSAECAGRQSRMVQSQPVLCRFECANGRQAPPPSHSFAIAIAE
jgi:hypothetical protein